MTQLRSSTPIGREAYLKRYIDTAERLGMQDDATVKAARDEYLTILERDCQRAMISAIRALFGPRAREVSITRTLFRPTDRSASGG